MNYEKQKLLKISQKIAKSKALTPDEANLLISFNKKDDESGVTLFLKQIALPISLLIGFFFAAFPSVFDSVANDLPKWTNLTPEILAGIDYYWDILGEPVGKANVIFHLPNVILYSFGIFGLKKVIDTLDRKTWQDKIYSAQTKLQAEINSGTQSYNLNKGHSILFIGSGDYIGMQFVLSNTDNEAITISDVKPKYTNLWVKFDSNTLYDDLKNVLILADCKKAGEYLFFPVKDDQIFLPNSKAYDISPHKLDILCQNIRNIEEEMGWENKRIIIIGDKFHNSFVQSEDSKKVIPHSADILTLNKLAKKYNNVTIIDPTDIVLKRIITLANGRKIVFRATKEGIKEYKERFFNRLTKLGYKQNKTKKGNLTIGYDLFEDQTEQQTLARIVDDYIPVVLSKDVKDALIRNDYHLDDFIYVPELVLNKLDNESKKQ